jgi:hypothetical protein
MTDKRASSRENGKLGGRPRGILVDRATEHIVSRRIVAHAVSDERTNQAATAYAEASRDYNVRLHE